jgi:putative FmdB family regulatory protein
MPIFEYVCRECNHQFEALVYGKQKGGVPQVSCDQARSTTLRVCGFGERLVQFSAVDGCVRIMRRSQGPGIVLSRRHELTWPY